MNKKKINILYVVFFAMYIMELAVIFIVSKNNLILSVGGVEYSQSIICGVLSEIQVLIAILMVICCGKKGIITSFVLTCISLSSTIINVFMLKDYSSLPGVTRYLGAYVIMGMVYYYLRASRKSQKAFDIMAHTDVLTGLPNRRMMTELLEKAATEQTPFALVFIDLDNFKGINDLMGHDYGDSLLREVARRWDSVRSANEVLARMGGDEFALLIINATSTDDVFAQVKRYQYKIKDKINIDNNDFYITASMGISMYPDDSTNTTELIRFADTAMYSAKDNTKRKIEFFNKNQMKKIEDDMKMQVMIHQANQNNSYFVEYQPLYSATDKTFRGVEALVRMRDSDGNVIRPKYFISIAEKNNLIVFIDKWVMNNTIETCSQYLKINPEFVLSVNISVMYLFSDSLIRDIKRALDTYNFPASNLEIEVTESVFISSLDNAASKLDELKKLGVRIALDDFGTGYASLSNLNNLPVDTLKIDKSFIDKIEDSEKDLNFVQAIIAMGHLLGLEVVSEGVETDSQLNLMRELNCDCIQGYVWGKPMAIDMVEFEATKTDKV